MPDDIEELAGVAPEQFVAARDALARRLKDAGESDRAKAVKALRRPTVAQWLATEVPRRRPEVVDALRSAARQVVDAQEAAIVRGDRDALRDATARHRAALRALESAVNQVLEETGRPAQHRDEIVQAVDESVTNEVSEGTFGVRDDLDLPNLEKARAPKRDVRAERRAAEADKAIMGARARVERAQDELAAAQAALEATIARYADAD
jgi:hypothetical protein